MTFTYYCDNCNKEWDTFTLGSEKPDTRCLICRKEGSRVFKGTAVNLNFNGSYNSTRSK